MSGVLYFNASVTNDNGLISLAKTEDDMLEPISFNNSFKSSILTRQSDYECAILRMVLPTDAIQIMNINADNQQDYKIGLTIGDYHSYMYLPRIIGIKELTPGTYPWSYNSQLDVVEAVNRSLTHCYNKFVQANYPLTVAYPVTSSFPSSINYVLGTVKYLAGIEVSIGGLNITNSTNAHIAIYFKTASSECLLWSGYMTDPEYALLTDAANPITFTDASLVPFSRCLDVKGVYKFQPVESLLNVVTQSTLSYQINIVSSDITITGTFKYGISMGYTTSYPTIPPSYNIDSKGLLTLQIQQSYIYRNIKIEMSPKLFRMFTFGAQSRRWIADEGMYQIIYPSVLLNHPIADNQYQILTIEQFQSTKYRFNNITNILVLARNLDVNGEYYQDYIKDYVLQDFYVDSSTDMENLLYTNDSAGLIPTRRYKMNSSLPLTSLAFEIFAQYSDGSSKRLNIRPGCTFQLKIGFFPL